MKFPSIKNLALTAVSIVAALALGEILLRQFVPVEPTIPDPILGFRMNPKLPDWDEHGFRNPAVLDHADIIAIGDSQTEGNNAAQEDAWPQELSRLAGKSVYQMAVGGYGPIQYLALSERGVELKPNVVLIGFYAGNDLSEALSMAYGNEHWSRFRDPAFTPVKSEATGPSVRMLLQQGEDPESVGFKSFQIRT